MISLKPATSSTTTPGRTHTTRPIVTGTSVLAVTYKGGVALTADTLGSYGKMSRFWNMSRLRPISTNTLLGASGDISDFQSVLDDLERARVEDVCAEDGAFLSTSEISSWLSRVTYQRRNKMNFLWNTFVVAGVTEKKEAYLSVVDKLGTSYQEKFAATGFGAHLALPLLRERWNPNLTKDEAKKLLEDCMRVLYYRDCRTINRIQFGTVENQTGKVEVSEPYVMETKWDFKSFVKVKAGAENGGSW